MNDIHGVLHEFIHVLCERGLLIQILSCAFCFLVFMERGGIN